MPIVPPFKAITRAGHTVTVIETKHLMRIGGVRFPVLGFFENPSNVDPYLRAGATGHCPVHWRADGGFAMSEPHPLDLVSIVLDDAPTPRPITAFNLQQDLTQPAASSVDESNHTKEIAMTKTINGMRLAALTETQAAIINSARAHSSKDERKQIKREVFAVVKAKFGIEPGAVVKCNTTGAMQRGYLLLQTGKRHRAGPGLAFELGDDGQWNGNLIPPEDLWPTAPAADLGDDLDDDGPNYIADEPVAAAGVQSQIHALPSGVKIVAQDNDHVIILFDDDEWSMEVIGRNDNRIVLTRD